MPAARAAFAKARRTQSHLHARSGEPGATRPAGEQDRRGARAVRSGAGQGPEERGRAVGPRRSDGARAGRLRRRSSPCCSARSPPSPHRSTPRLAADQSAPARRRRARRTRGGAGRRRRRSTRNSRILDALGRAQLAAGDTNQAIDTFNRLVAAEPRSTLPLRAPGRVPTRAARNPSGRPMRCFGRRSSRLRIRTSTRDLVAALPDRWARPTRR